MLKIFEMVHLFYVANASLGDLTILCSVVALPVNSRDEYIIIPAVNTVFFC